MYYVIHNNNKNNNNKNNNNKNNNHYGFMINILPAHIFDISILLLALIEVVNQLRQTVYKLIETCKSILNATVGLRRRGLYNNNNEISLAHWFDPLISYH